LSYAYTVGYTASGGDFTLGTDNMGPITRTEVREGGVGSNDWTAVYHRIETVTQFDTEYDDAENCKEVCREMKYFYNADNGLAKREMGNEYERECGGGEEEG